MAYRGDTAHHPCQGVIQGAPGVVLCVLREVETRGVGTLSWLRAGPVRELVAPLPPAFCSFWFPHFRTFKQGTLLPRMWTAPTREPNRPLDPCFFMFVMAISISIALEFVVSSCHVCV